MTAREQPTGASDRDLVFCPGCGGWSNAELDGCPRCDRTPDESGARRRRVIKQLDSRFIVPDDIEPLRILLVTQEANNDGGTGWHYVYHVLAEEAE